MEIKLSESTQELKEKIATSVAALESTGVDSIKVEGAEGFFITVPGTKKDKQALETHMPMGVEKVDGETFNLYAIVGEDF